MKIVNINSGLGNQMFQFAFYLSLKNKYKGEEVKIDTSWFEVDKFHNGFELERVFNINPSHSTHQENVILSRSGYSLYGRIKRRLLVEKKNEIIELKEQQYNFSKKLYGKEGGDGYYRGYWQSYKYFESIPEVVKSSFIFPPLSESKNINMCSFLENNKDRTISIHVRMGDYLNHKSLGGVCTLNYYREAILKMEGKIKNPVYIFFSDDMAWCKKNFKLPNIKFVDWNSGELSFRDMQLMSLCGNNIIANSSFSWWGAFLNSNKDKTVIAPKIWIRGIETEDLIPNDWSRL
jgi:hypothetical protein